MGILRLEQRDYSKYDRKDCYTIAINQIPATCTTESLNALLSNYGEVTSITLSAKKSGDGAWLNEAVACFNPQTDRQTYGPTIADIACLDLNGKEFGGSKLEVKNNVKLIAEEINQEENKEEDVTIKFIK